MSQFAFAITQGLAGGFQAASNIVGQQLKEEADIRAGDRKLADAERLKAIDESFQARAEERKRQNALRQGRDIETGATGLLNSEVATSINSRFGSSMDPADPETRAAIEAIRRNPEAAKAYGLEAEDDLKKARARTQAARNIGDLAAAKEEEGSVRTLVSERTAKEKGERDERRLDIMEEFQRNQAERQNKIAEATLAHQKRMETSADARATAAETASMRAATAKALDGVNADIKALEKEAADPMLDPSKQAVVKKQLDAARQEAAGYRRSLAGAGLATVDAPEPQLEKPTPASDAKLLSNPNLKDAYIKRFGQAEYERVTKAKTADTTTAPPAAEKRGMLSSAEGDLTKATTAQLWAAVESQDPLQKKFAVQELRRRGLLAPEEAASRAGPSSYFDQG